MPLYEYACENGHRFEVIQKFSDPPLDRCTRCGAPVQKLQSAPAFQFKGSGWYITDYARKDQSAGSNESSKTTTENKSTSETSKSNTETPAAASKESAKPADSAPSGGGVKTE